MLVLSRRRGERIVFPGLGVTIEVVRLAGNRVQLGIAAPPEIAVHREEVAQAVKEFAALSATTPTPLAAAPASCG